MAQLYEINTTGAPGTAALKVFDGAGSQVFDSRYASLSKWLTGFTSVPPRWSTAGPGASYVSDVPHNHPSGKSCLTVCKVRGRRYIGGVDDWRTLFVRVYDINSHEGDFMTVGTTFIRFGNMSYDQSPWNDNTHWYHYTMFNAPTE